MGADNGNKVVIALNVIKLSGGHLVLLDNLTT